LDNRRAVLNKAKSDGHLCDRCAVVTLTHALKSLKRGNVSHVTLSIVSLGTYYHQHTPNTCVKGNHTDVQVCSCAGSGSLCHGR
jgi:hypothetical protein